MLDVGIGVEDAASRMFPVVPRPAGDVIGRCGSLPPPLTTIFGFGLALSFHGSVEQAPKPGRSGALFEEQVWGTSLHSNSDNSEQGSSDNVNMAESTYQLTLIAE
jgi:hypothetical protein